MARDYSQPEAPGKGLNEGLMDGPNEGASTLAPGALGSYCMNGSVKGVLKGLGLKPAGRFRIWWTSQGMRSNGLTLSFPKPVCHCRPCGCHP